MASLDLLSLKLLVYFSNCIFAVVLCKSVYAGFLKAGLVAYIFWQFDY